MYIGEQLSNFSDARLALAAQLGLECGVATGHRRIMAQGEELDQDRHEGIGPHPRRIFDARPVVRDRRGIAGKGRKAIAVGDPGREQRCGRGDADLDGIELLVLRDLLKEVE